MQSQWEKPTTSRQLDFPMSGRTARRSCLPHDPTRSSRLAARRMLVTHNSCIIRQPHDQLTYSEQGHALPQPDTQPDASVIMTCAFQVEPSYRVPCAARHRATDGPAGQKFNGRFGILIAVGTNAHRQCGAKSSRACDRTAMSAE